MPSPTLIDRDHFARIVNCPQGSAAP